MAKWLTRIAFMLAYGYQVGRYIKKKDTLNAVWWASFGLLMLSLTFRE